MWSENSGTMWDTVLTYACDVKAPRRLQGPSGPSVPEHLEVHLFALDQQHVLIYPTEEEDL